MKITMGLLQDMRYKTNRGRKRKPVVITEEEIESAKKTFFAKGGQVTKMRRENKETVSNKTGNQHLYVSSDGGTKINLPEYKGKYE